MLKNKYTGIPIYYYTHKYSVALVNWWVELNKHHRRATPTPK